MKCLYYRTNTRYGRYRINHDGRWYEYTSLRRAMARLQQCGLSKYEARCVLADARRNRITNYSFAELLQAVDRFNESVDSSLSNQTDSAAGRFFNPSTRERSTAGYG